MTPEEYMKQFKKFTLQEQQDIMTELMPDFCQTMMSNPAQMQNMMQRCSQMMGSSFMAKNRRMPPFGKGADK